MRKVMTLCFVHQHPKILLGMKKRGFGEGRWNGFGGKVEEGEDIEEAMRRELLEEVGLTPNDLEKRGIMEFSFESEPKVLEVHVFGMSDFSGDPKESEEMRPEWFHMDEIPFPQMWPDDLYWVPLFLKGAKFKGKFHFDRPSDAEYSAQILKHELNEVEEL